MSAASTQGLGLTCADTSALCIVMLHGVASSELVCFGVRAHIALHPGHKRGKEFKCSRSERCCIAGISLPRLYTSLGQGQQNSVHESESTALSELQVCQSFQRGLMDTNNSAISYFSAIRSRTGRHGTPKRRGFVVHDAL